MSEGVGEWRSLGATKNAKFAKASNLRKTPLFDFDSRLRLQKNNQQAKPFAAVALKRGEEGDGESRQEPRYVLRSPLGDGGNVRNSV